MDAFSFPRRCSSRAFFPAESAIFPMARVLSPSGPGFDLAKFPHSVVSKARKGPPTTHPTRPQPTRMPVSEGGSVEFEGADAGWTASASTIGGSVGTGSKVKSLSPFIVMSELVCLFCSIVYPLFD